MLGTLLATALAAQVKPRIPSPAEPGMVLPTAVSQDVHAPGPEAPDPTHGVDPNDEGPYGRNLVLRPMAYSVWKLDQDTEMGRAGDYLIAVDGSGFMDGTSRPIVHLGDSVHLEDVYVNPSGTSLLVVVPREMDPLVRRWSFESLAIQNPGGLDRDCRRWGRLKMTREELVQQMEDAHLAALKYGAYELSLDVK